MTKFLHLCIRNRLLVVLFMAGIVVFGVFQYSKLPNDAFPDVSPVMVPVFAEAHGMAPEEIERLITFPIESAMNGLPGVRQVKSTSAFGMAVVYVYFKDNVDIYFARQIVAERLAAAELPDMEERPALGPISTGLGEVFMYYLTADSSVETGGKDRDVYLREVNDWIVKYQLQTVPGVTEILSMGGHVLQYQVNVNPSALNKYKLSLDDVVQAITSNNRNAGGQFLVLGSEEYLVRGIGLVESLDHLRAITVKTVDGTPVRLADVAEVKYGRETRRGVVTRNGAEEVVAGIVMKLYGQNTSEVIKRLNAKIPAVQRSLPKGIRLMPYYSQSTLVERATHPVNSAHIQLMLKPVKQWKKHRTKAKLVESINRALAGYPGVQLNFSQPIQNMFDELLSGVKTQLAIKLFGDDSNVLKAKAEEIKEVITPIRGLVDLSLEQSFGHSRRCRLWPTAKRARGTGSMFRTSSKSSNWPWAERPWTRCSSTPAASVYRCGLTNATGTIRRPSVISSSTRPADCRCRSRRSRGSEP